MRLKERLGKLACATAAALVLSSCATTDAASGTFSGAYADNPERGRQGEILPGEAGVLPRPYNRGVRVVGHSSVFERDGNVLLAWVDHCAYVAGTIPQINLGGTLDPEKLGVAVIDVSDPANPRDIKLLRTPASIRTAETIHAVSTPGRKLLAVGDYAGGNAQFGPKDPASLEIYDASDCANPRLMSKFVWPENAHTLTLSPDGRYLVGTFQSQNPPFTGKGGLMVLDLLDPSDPRYIGTLGVTSGDGKRWEFASHEVSFSADGRRIYAAVTDSTGNDLNPGLKPGFSMERVSPDNGGVYILDSSDLMDGKPDPELRLIGTIKHGGWHSVMPANIGGVPYLVGGGELAACPGAFPKISNIADEANPFIEGEFRLDMNQPENCPPSTISPMNPFGAPSATLHYNDVDNAADTRLGLFNFTAAGLRIADLRNPEKPVELGYFRPGDACTGHVRFIPATAQVWLTCFESGFWVLELSPDLRKAVGLPRH